MWGLLPAWWLLAVTALITLALRLTGYLSVYEKWTSLDALARLVPQDDAPLAALRRGAMAQSGVTLGLTWALTLCIMWIAAARLRKCALGYSLRVVSLLLAMAILAIALLAEGASRFEPSFASQVGWALLDMAQARLGITHSNAVADSMFFLGCLAPAFLAAGACLLLQPMRRPKYAAAAAAQLEPLRGRLRELDQLLYAGAFALVFGTLQLSAAFSVPIAGMPDAVDLKRTLDICNAQVGMMHKAAAVTQIAGPGESSPAECRVLGKLAGDVAAADGLREFRRSLTLSFGLAFSALLAAIYVPALLSLRAMAQRAVKVLQNSTSATYLAMAKDAQLSEMEPLQRLATFVATASPLLAGLVSNALGTS